MTKPHPMQQFHDMLEHILEQGTQQPNRTGVDAISVPGYHLNFDMRDGFPAITTKKLAFKAAVGETIGFFRGFTSAAQFREIGCKVWDGNANETAAWLKNPNDAAVFEAISAASLALSRARPYRSWAVPVTWFATPSA